MKDEEVTECVSLSASRKSELTEICVGCGVPLQSQWGDLGIG
jgi:hypothetical protein